MLVPKTLIIYIKNSLPFPTSSPDPSSLVLLVVKWPRSFPFLVSGLRARPTAGSFHRLRIGGGEGVRTSSFGDDIGWAGCVMEAVEQLEVVEEWSEDIALHCLDTCTWVFEEVQLQSRHMQFLSPPRSSCCRSHRLHCRILSTRLTTPIPSMTPSLVCQM